MPDNRAPVVTHYVWYRVGAADEPAGVSGIAHFLEHLMFKSTDKIASGEFSKTISRLGGQDNAFTTHDYTGYFQRISKDRLKTVMEMEADRMVNLKLDDEGGGDRARGDPRGAPLAHREQSRPASCPSRCRRRCTRTIPTASRSSAGCTR